MSMWNDLREKLNAIKAAKKMYTPKDQKDENKMTVKPKQFGLPMTPEELQENMKANRGTGAHVNKKDKRSKNPAKQDWD